VARDAVEGIGELGRGLVSRTELDGADAFLGRRHQ
jgi:hypothetical protein